MKWNKSILIGLMLRHQAKKRKEHNTFIETLIGVYELFLCLTVLLLVQFVESPIRKIIYKGSFKDKFKEWISVWVSAYKGLRV